MFAAASYWVALAAAGDFGFRLGLGERPQISLGLAHTVSYRADPKLPTIPALRTAPKEAAADPRPVPAESARLTVPAVAPAARSARPPQPTESKATGQQSGEHSHSDGRRGDD